MKPTTLAILAGAASTMIAAAGPAPDATVPLTAEKSEPWLVPTFNIRTRYEYANVARPFTGDSTAFTIRERVGLRVGAFFGFSAFAEYEGTQLIDNHFSTPFPTQPGPAPRTPIADPENNELNRAWVQWEGYESGVKLGRQRIILDNAAMIGNVGWRQNEQTYDAANLMVGALENFEFRYVYIDRVLRIFGNDAEGATRNFAGDTHLIHAAWKGPQDFKLTGYAYLILSRPGATPRSLFLFRHRQVHASTTIGGGAESASDRGRSSSTAALAALRPRFIPFDTLLRRSSGTSSRAKYAAKQTPKAPP